MQKRGQVTIFIILGIVVLAVLAWLFFIKGDILGTITGDERADVFVASQVEPIKGLVDDCTRKQLVDSIIYVSRSGGYFDPPVGEEYCEGYTEDLECEETFLIAHSYVEGQNRLVMLDKFASELQDYMMEEENLNRLKGCINNGLNDFEDKGLSISNREFILGVPEIGAEEVYQKVSFNPPLEIKKDDYVATVNEVVASANAPLKRVQNVAADITECYMGMSIPDNYNSYCEFEGSMITFNAGWYGVDILKDSDIMIGNMNNCNTECVDCYFIRFDVEEFEAEFNVLLKEC
ncbi:hypothetical protein HOG16_01620 [Candidatus Woesearchaeota archaeon]|mgnify:CR=1 FL=1|jgi:hypothetical protein|nr:hypothetical protein [Candidatus Woesearchaeota archaeon]MBT4322066.1 hypothetical protein [Candidatus Woesearchaeota archaeon]MBT4630643.1 hypothetical protein [Candidatus Woesearchaeota archaeon]